MSVTLTITGDDPMAVAAMVRLLGIREVTITPYDLGLAPPVAPEPEPAETIPEPYQNHTPPQEEPRQELSEDIDETPPPSEPEPEPVSPPVRRYTERRQQDAADKPDPDAMTPERQEVLDCLSRYRAQTSAEVAATLGQSSQGVSSRLRWLMRLGYAAEKRTEDGKRGYVRTDRWGDGTPVEPAEETDQTPTPPPVLPARAPYLHISDLSGHARSIAETLAAEPLPRHVLAEQLGLADEDVRDTLRLLMRQGYVTRLDGNVVRYALTDAVVREELAS